MFSADKSKINAAEDSALLLQYRQTGDLVFIGELYKRYAKQILSACVYYFNDKDDAKDHVMQIFDKLIVELKSREVDNFKGWLSFVVRNYCISVIRKQKTDKKRLNDYQEHEYTMQSEETELALEKIKDAELNEKLLKESLNDLKEGQRKCIDLFYLQNKSYQQIESITGYSSLEVKSYIQNGKRNLKLLILEKQKMTVNPHAK